MKERILFECVGQAGGNIGRLFEENGYNCMFINASNDDLLTINAKNKYHIPGGMGCNKDRQKALRYAKDYYNTMIDVIDSKFPLQDIVFFIFSLGGGTGSGIGPVMLDILSQKNPEKTYGAIIIMPSDSESLQAQLNAVEAYKQLVSVENLKSLFVLNNNCIIDKLEINKKFFGLFDRFLNITVPDERGIIDSAELETLLKCKGNTIMMFLDHSANDKCIEEGCLINPIFLNNEHGCRYIATSTIERANMSVIKNKFGAPIDTFEGYNNKDNFIVVAGMKYPEKAIQEFTNDLNEKLKNAHVNNDFKVNIPDIITEKKETTTITVNKNIDFNSIFEKYK